MSAAQSAAWSAVAIALTLAGGSMVTRCHEKADASLEHESHNTGQRWADDGADDESPDEVRARMDREKAKLVEEANEISEEYKARRLAEKEDTK